MNARPCRRIRRERSVIIAAAIIQIPLEDFRIHSLPSHPLAKRNTVQVSLLSRQPVLHRNRESAARAKLMDEVLHPTKLLTIFLTQPNRRLNALLPPSIQEQSLLRREAQISLLPLAVLEDSQLLKQLPHVNRLGPRHRHIVCGPRIRRDLVLSPP